MNDALKSDIGNRESNQDKIAKFTRLDQTKMYILCDGMGGCKGGEVASSECVKLMGNSFKKSKFNSLQTAKEWIYNSIVDTNEKILKKGESDISLKGMGTTLISLIINKDYKLYASVGDSRIYKYNYDNLVQLSDDQTFTNALLKAGYISKKEATIHPKKNMLLCAVGSTLTSQLDVQVKEIDTDDNFLLCSDGLYNMLTDKDIFNILSSGESINNKASALIDLANINGGKDNISVILVEDIR